MQSVGNRNPAIVIQEKKLTLCFLLPQ